MYQRAQEQAAASARRRNGAGSTDGSEAEDVVDAEVVDEGR